MPHYGFRVIGKSRSEGKASSVNHEPLLKGIMWTDFTQSSHTSVWPLMAMDRTAEIAYCLGSNTCSSLLSAM